MKATTWAAWAFLLAVGFGFGEAGVLGALTGGVVVLLLATGATIASGSRESEVQSPDTLAGVLQRLCGIGVEVGAIAAAMRGGWRWGWAWGLAGAIAGFAIILGLAKLVTGLSRARARRRPASTEGTPATLKGMTGPQFVCSACSLAASTINVFIFGAVTIGFVASRWPTVGKIGMWVYLAYFAWDAVMVLFTTLAGIVFIVGYIFVRAVERERSLGWMYGANAVRVVEVCVGLIGVGYVLAANGYMGIGP